MTEPYALLTALMEPTPDAEDEFNDWYDTEHVPERARLPDFLTAQRFVSISGWPRYAAMYDVTRAAALQDPSYTGLAGANLSPWSKRVLARTRGRMRMEGIQIHPGQAKYGQSGTPTRLTLLRIEPGNTAESDVMAALRGPLAEDPAVLQIRAWRCSVPSGSLLVAIESKADLPGLAQHLAALHRLPVSVPLHNTYVPHWRQR